MDRQSPRACPVNHRSPRLFGQQVLQPVRRQCRAEQSGISLDRKAENQIRDAIAQAPSHGLKPDLFLKGGEKGEALVQAGLKYASALANGYTDPRSCTKSIPSRARTTDVRAGMRQAIEDGNVGEWLDSLAPQTDEYKALAKRAFAAMPSKPRRRQFSRYPQASRSSPARAIRACPAIVAVLRSGGYLPAERQPQAAERTQP